MPLAWKYNSSTLGMDSREPSLVAADFEGDVGLGRHQIADRLVGK